MKNFSLAVAFGGLAFAQDQPPLPPAQDQQPPVQDQNAPPAQQPNGGWRRFGDGQSSSSVNSGQAPMNQAPMNQPQANQPNQQQAPSQGGYQGGYSATMPPAYQAPVVPPSLTVPAGTWVTVRTTNPISTDHNQVGDAFSAILTEPVVVNGFVVARRGQTIQGRVSTVEKAGRFPEHRNLAWNSPRYRWLTDSRSHCTLKWCNETVELPSAVTPLPSARQPLPVPRSVRA